MTITLPRVEHDAVFFDAEARRTSMNSLVRLALRTERTMHEKAGEGFVPHLVHCQTGEDRILLLPEHYMELTRQYPGARIHRGVQVE